MAASAAAVNLRITGSQHQGTKDCMEDFCSAKRRKNIDGGDDLFACFGIYDGHGGREVAEYTKDNLISTITKSPKFSSDDDNQVLSAIREGFTTVHQVMYEELWQHWKLKADGRPSTAGSTATICFIMRGKLYIAHVGDSKLVLARKNPLVPAEWKAIQLTEDHRPDNEVELARIQSAGGKVAKSASGTPRVVRRKTTLDEKTGQPRYKDKPCLNISRALGNFWSYNAENAKFVISPDPDVAVYNLDLTTDQCIILASDGLWDYVSADMAVQTVNSIEKGNAQPNSTWISPSKKLCQLALEQGTLLNIKNDNITVITVILSQVSPHSVNPKTNSADYVQSRRSQEQQLTPLEVEKETTWRIKI